MNAFIINIMNKFGYFGITFLITVENIFPPIPSEVILTLGGFMTRQDGCTMSLLGVIFFSTLGSVVGAIILYGLGYLINRDRLIKIVNSSVGKILCLKEKDIVKSDSWFDKNGSLTVFYCRFIPIVRSLISIPAGVNKMRFLIFLIYTTIGSIIWNTVLVTLGVIVGDNYLVVAKVFSKYSKLLLVGLILIILYKFIKKILTSEKREKT